ncbi:MAG: NADH-quinone oxidoreductase subunit NuoE [Candidatus Altiarchaeota archaeon]
MEKNLDSILAKYSRPGEVIDALEDVQEEYGFISEEHMRRIQQKLSVPLVDVVGVVTFYSAFKLISPGRHVIRLCNGTACHVKGAAGLRGHLKDKLKVEAGETTSDGRFTLETVNCIGACAKAPSMMVDGTVYGNLTVEKIDEILGSYK